MTATDPAQRPLSPWAAGLLLVVVGRRVRPRARCARIRPGRSSSSPTPGSVAYLVTRRPRNTVGWLLMLTGRGPGTSGASGCRCPLEPLQTGMLDPAQALRPGRTASAGRWRSSASSRSRSSSRAAACRRPRPMAGAARSRGHGGRSRCSSRSRRSLSVTVADTGPHSTIPNPSPSSRMPASGSLVPDPATLYLTMFVVVVGGVSGWSVRYRRSTGLERLQIPLAGRRPSRASRPCQRASGRIATEASARGRLGDSPHAA